MVGKGHPVPGSSLASVSSGSGTRVKSALQVYAAKGRLGVQPIKPSPIRVPRDATCLRVVSRHFNSRVLDGPCFCSRHKTHVRGPTRAAKVSAASGVVMVRARASWFSLKARAQSPPPHHRTYRTPPTCGSNASGSTSNQKQTENDSAHAYMRTIKLFQLRPSTLHFL
jgi:hypothetical protein